MSFTPAPALDNESALKPKGLSRLAFLREVAAIYKANFGLFVGIIAPAVFFGYIAVYAGNSKAEEMIQPFMDQLFAGKKPSISHALQAGAFRWGGYAISWLAYSYAFAATCAAVRGVSRNESVSVSESYARARNRSSALIRSSLVLGVLTGIGFFAAVIPGLLLASYLNWKQHPETVSILMIAMMSAVFVGVAKLSLSLPAVVLDPMKVRNAIFLSDELTEGRNILLFFLLLESIGGSYLAAIVPYLIADGLWPAAPWPQYLEYVLLAAAIIGGALIQPHLFIGLGHLYETQRAKKMQG